MIYVQYDEAVREMAKGLTRFMGEEDAKHLPKSSRATRWTAFTATA